MDEGVLIERVNEMIETIVGRRDATRALRDPDLAPLARIAADLRHYPSAEFKARLRGRLQSKTASLVAVAAPRMREGFTSLTPTLRSGMRGCSRSCRACLAVWKRWRRSVHPEASIARYASAIR